MCDCDNPCKDLMNSLEVFRRRTKGFASPKIWSPNSNVQWISIAEGKVWSVLASLIILRNSSCGGTSWPWKECRKKQQAAECFDYYYLVIMKLAEDEGMCEQYLIGSWVQETCRACRTRESEKSCFQWHHFPLSRLNSKYFSQLAFRCKGFKCFVCQVFDRKDCCAKLQRLQIRK